MPTSTRARHRRGCNRREAEVLSVQARGEYLYAACGEGGLRVFDIAFIDHKGFSERITTAPVSPLGQQFYVRTKYATAVAAPTTTAPDPTRKQPNPENQEQQPIHPLYGYIYVADKYEGLILVGAGDAARRQPAEQLPQARADVQPGRPPQRRDEHHDRRHLRLHLLRRRPGRRRPRRPDRAEGASRRSARRAASARRRSRSSSATPSSATRRASRSSTSPTWRSRSSSMAQDPDRRGRTQHLPGPDLRLRRGGQAGAGDPRHREARTQPKIDQVYNAGGLHQRPARREAGHHLHQRSSPTWPTARTACGWCSSPRRRRRATTASARGRRRS